MGFNVSQYELTRSAAKSFVTSIASGGSNTTLVDSTQHLDTDLYKDQVIEIISASNNAKYMSNITSHTDTTFTFDALDDGYQVAVGDLYHIFSLGAGGGSTTVDLGTAGTGITQPTGGTGVLGFVSSCKDSLANLYTSLSSVVNGGKVQAKTEDIGKQVVILSNSTYTAPQGTIAVTLPNTPSAYAKNAVIGTKFTVPAINTNNGGAGIMYGASVKEVLDTGSYTAEPVTLDATTGTFTLTNGNIKLKNGQRIIINGGSAPSAFSLNQFYYVIGISGQTFKLSSYVAGSAITGGTNGSNLTIAEIATCIPVKVYMSNTDFTATLTDNIAFAPTVSDMLNIKPAISFSNYDYSGVHAIAKDDGYQRIYACDAASNNFYMVLVCDTPYSYGQLSTTAHLEISLFELRY